MQLNKFIETAVNEIKKGCNAAEWGAGVLANTGQVGGMMGIAFDLPVNPDTADLIGQGTAYGVSVMTQTDIEDIGENKIDPARLTFIIVVEENKPE